MGVLFGLAMDYEMFLVSAMREDFVHSGDARQAVFRGFKASSRVVTAAALIMVSVFVAFIPAGTATIQQIAFGLAVGVFVDAFVVRMTLVPAVMVLLDRRAWWLPRSVDRRVPVVDVEGAALHRKIEYEQWEAANGEATLLARDLVVHEGGLPVQLAATAGRVNRLTVPDAGRCPRPGPRAGGAQRGPSAASSSWTACCCRSSARRSTGARRSIELERRDGPTGPVEDEVQARAHVAVLTRRRRRAFVERTFATMDELTAALSAGRVHLRRGRRPRRVPERGDRRGVAGHRRRGHRHRPGEDRAHERRTSARDGRVAGARAGPPRRDRDPARSRRGPCTGARPSRSSASQRARRQFRSSPGARSREHVR